MGLYISNGVRTKTPTTIWRGTPATWNVELSGRWSSYASLYSEQLWVRTVVDKRGKATARLPLKVYEHDDMNRPEARDHPYAQLLRRPNSRHSPFFLWLWSSSTFDTYGEFFWGKVRDRGGRPVELVPLHPTGMYEEDERDGRTIWRFQNDRIRIDGIGDEDLVHPRTYNPGSFTRGLSHLESLRRTLENEDAARRATSAFWRNGGRPSVALKHPKTIGDKTIERLRLQWNDVHGGVDNFGKAVILEEGMEAQILSLNVEEAQYIETRRLNREEVCAVYDIPPPVVHILDRATFSNITEQMRSMYRDTMAPHLKGFEAELEVQLRGAVRPGASEPDFGDEVYAEFLMDEVLRGDFETRTAAWVSAVQNGGATIAEWRRAENRPFIDGTDRLHVNGAFVPFTTDADDMQAQADFAGAVGIAVQRLGLGVNYGVLSADDARELLPGVTGPAPTLPERTVRSLMGRLSRQKTLDEVDADALTAGLNGDAGIVVAALEVAKAAGYDLPTFRRRLQSLQEVRA